MRAMIAVATALLLAACTSPAASSPAGDPSAARSSGASPALAAPDWPAYHGDAARSGVSTAMPAVRGAPRVAIALNLDGNVYASPITAHGLIIVATEHDSVYALDTAGKQRWRVGLGEPSPAAERPCGNIDPLGITGTPVFDASTQTVFVATEYGGSSGHELVALDVASGAVRWRRSLDLPGAAPVAMQDRGALTVADGRVWVPFGGLAGDCGDYKGRVIGTLLDGSGVPVSYTVPTTREGGIWTPPGPSVGAAGHLFVSVGNGAAVAGDQYDHSDAVLELDGHAQLVDSFSPTVWATDNAGDRDLGSQGPALVGPWVFIAGKSGTAYVLRQSALSSTGGIGGEVSQTALCTSFGGTAVAGDVVYVPCTDGLRAVRIDARGGLHVLWRASAGVTGSPVVGGGRVWALDPGAGVLHALDPATGKSSGTVAVGPVSRFATAALYGRDVLVPTLRGLTVVVTS